MDNKVDPVAEAAEAEIETLARTIQVLEERLRKLRSVAALLRGAGGSGAVPVQSVEIIAKVTTRAEPKAEAIEGRLTKKQQVREAIRELLTERGVVSRQELLGYLIHRGLMGHELKPLKRLGNLLHMFKDEFGSDGRGSYHLRQSDPSKPGQRLP